MSQDPFPGVIRAIRAAGGADLPSSVDRGDSLVLTLGFDSMKMAALSLSLESECGFPIVLDEWIASHPDPHDLTVGSLCDYLQGALQREHLPFGQ